MRADGLVIAIALALAAHACGPRQEGASSSAASPESAAQATTPAVVPAGKPELDPCAGMMHAICNDKGVAALSDRMKTALAQTAAAVSPEGLKVLAANERGWLDAKRVECGVPPGATALDGAQSACLRAAFAARLQDAWSAVEKKGPFTFQRVEVSRTDKVSSSAAARLMGADAPKSLAHAIAFPRIDGDDPIVRKFNDAVRQGPRFKAADQTEETTTYKIGYAGADLVSVRFDRRDLTIGGARPNASASAVNFSMRTATPLTAQDLFNAKSKWQDALAAEAAQKLTEQLRAEDDSARPIDPADIRGAVGNPASWFVTDKALVLLFSSGALAPATTEFAEVAIPWRDLKPYLNRNAPGPARKSA